MHLEMYTCPPAICTPTVLLYDLPWCYILMLIECIILAKWAQIILWWTLNTCPVKTTDHVIDVHYISANITLITFNDSSWPLDIYHMFLDGQPKWHTILYLLHITFNAERHDLLISECDNKLDVFWTGWLFYYCGMTLVT